LMMVFEGGLSCSLQSAKRRTNLSGRTAVL
jgi:hypothetical protein